MREGRLWRKKIWKTHRVNFLSLLNYLQEVVPHQKAEGSKWLMFSYKPHLSRWRDQERRPI
jgi:hypothetical protein